MRHNLFTDVIYKTRENINTSPRICPIYYGELCSIVPCNVYMVAVRIIFFKALLYDEMD